MNRTLSDLLLQNELDRANPSVRQASFDGEEEKRSLAGGPWRLVDKRGDWGRILKKGDWGRILKRQENWGRILKKGDWGRILKRGGGEARDEPKKDENW